MKLSLDPSSGRFRESAAQSLFGQEQSPEIALHSGRSVVATEAMRKFELVER